MLKENENIIWKKETDKKLYFELIQEIGGDL